MMDRLPRHGVVRFASCEIALDSAELRRGGVLIALPTQPVRLLAALALRSGHLLDRDEIRRHLWADGTTVEFDQGINQCIRQIRQVLGDSASSPRWIQTLPGRGYRFLVPASYSPGEGDQEGAVPPATTGGAAMAPDITSDSLPAELPPPSPPSSMDGRWHIPGRVVAVVAVVVVVAAAWVAAMMVGSRSSDRVSSVPPPSPPSRQSASTAPRLVVLPMAALDRTGESLAGAFSEELISALGERYAHHLAVIAPRTAMRYRGTKRSVAELGAELEVDYLVDGTVSETTAAPRRLSVQLVRCSDQIQLWARTFTLAGEDVQAVIDTIADDVATALAITLVPDVSEPALGAAAEEVYLRGRYALRRGRVHQAMAAFAEASSLAPQSAKVWAARGLAALRRGDGPSTPGPNVAPCPNCGGSVAARRFADAALAINAGNAEAHYVRATLALFRDWNLGEAYRHFSAAIATNPGYAEAHHDLAAVFAARGHHRDAIASVQRALVLDPFAPEVVSDVGWYYLFAGRFAEAASWCERTLAFEPHFYYAHRCVILARSLAGDLDGAARAAARDLSDRGAEAALIARIAGDDASRVRAPGTSIGAGVATVPRWSDLGSQWRASRAAQLRLIEYWRWDVEAARSGRFGSSQDPSDLAMSYVGAQDFEAAITQLESAVAARAGWLLPFLAVDPTFAALRAHPRFVAIVAAVASAKQ